MLRWLGDIKIAINSLKATKVRTALTILGIVIGVASVTVVLSLGEGAKNTIRGQIKQLGDNILTIRPGKATRDAFGNILNYNFLAALGSSTITERDLNTVAQTEGIASAAPFMLVTGSVGNGERTADNSVIVATNEDCLEVLDLSMAAGEFVNNKTTRETVVLGRELAIDLLGTDVGIGQTVFLRGKEFTVIGILRQFESSATISNVFDLNRAAFIPLDAGKGFNQGIAQIQQINARTDNGHNIKDVAGNLHQKLLANHTNEEDFTVLRPEEALKLTDDLFRILTGFTSAIASISIIVGGIGIMNIMLVSVTERTREIGIRKAVGATNRQILSQFMIEALVMSVVGGVLGIAAGYGLAFFVGTLLGFMPGVTWQIIAIALAVSLAVGVIFGAWPAIKAARKDPIEALRYFQ
ncbi:MAG: ABC transporter permease [Candidatus Saccharimonadales bacterium]